MPRRSPTTPATAPVECGIRLYEVAAAATAAIPAAQTGITIARTLRGIVLGVVTTTASLGAALRR
jgi:hypothetical protein